MIRFGIMGPGRIADVFCKAVKVVEGAKVTAVASKSAERARLGAERNGIEAWYGDYETMLKEHKPDAVYIATTHNFHYENILLCIEHGIPVLCEKPMVLTAAQAKDVFEKAKAKKVFVMEAMWSRFVPAYIKAKELLQSGAIGQIISANYDVGFCADKASRVVTKETAGGAMYDVGVYGIEALADLVGLPLKSSQAAVLYNEFGVDMTTHLTMDFGSCLANMRCSIECTMAGTAVFNGTQGRMLIEEPVHSCKKIHLHKTGKPEQIFEQSTENGFQYEIRHFIDCLEKGLLESSVMPHKDTLVCAELFDKSLVR